MASEDRGTAASHAPAADAIASGDRPRSRCAGGVWDDSSPGIPPFPRKVGGGSDCWAERLSDRCGRTTGGPPQLGRGRPASVRSVRSLSPPFNRSSGQARHLAVAAQSLVDHVRLAALCGLLRCDTAESPKGTGAGAWSRLWPRELASGSSESGGDRSLPGIRIPGSGPVAEDHGRPADGENQGILRTVRRTIGVVLQART